MGFSGGLGTGGGGVGAGFGGTGAGGGGVGACLGGAGAGGGGVGVGLAQAAASDVSTSIATNTKAKIFLMFIPPPLEYIFWLALPIFRNFTLTLSPPFHLRTQILINNSSQNSVRLFIPRSPFVVFWLV